MSKEFKSASLFISLFISNSSKPHKGGSSQCQLHLHRLSRIFQHCSAKLSGPDPLPDLQAWNITGNRGLEAKYLLPPVVIFISLDKNLLTECFWCKAPSTQHLSHLETHKGLQAFPVVPISLTYWPPGNNKSRQFVSDKFHLSRPHLKWCCSTTQWTLDQILWKSLSRWVTFYKTFSFPWILY